MLPHTVGATFRRLRDGKLMSNRKQEYFVFLCGFYAYFKVFYTLIFDFGDGHVYGGEEKAGGCQPPAIIRNI